VASATGAPDRARQTAHELEIEHSYTSLEALLECKDLDGCSTPCNVSIQSEWNAALQQYDS
jgi:hypothetical protein